MPRKKKQLSLKLRLDLLLAIVHQVQQEGRANPSLGSDESA